jgi:hypothetical protein
MQKHTVVRPGGGSNTARCARRLSSVLTAQERKVIAMLRKSCVVDAADGSPDDGDGGGASHGTHRAFVRLAAEIRMHRLTVFGERSIYVSDDELAILRWLSMLQRPSQSAHLRMANPFQHALKGCAEELVRGDERRLPARSVLADACVEREDCFRITLLGGPTDAAPEASSAPTDSPEAKVLALVDAQKFATASQFRALGISTQKLSRLCRRGYVERVALGLYKKVGGSAPALAG